MSAFGPYDVIEDRGRYRHVIRWADNREYRIWLDDETATWELVVD